MVDQVLKIHHLSHICLGIDTLAFVDFLLAVSAVFFVFFVVLSIDCPHPLTFKLLVVSEQQII